MNSKQLRDDIAIALWLHHWKGAPRTPPDWNTDTDRMAQCREVWRERADDVLEVVVPLLERLNREAVDLQYMCDAYFNMLGPNGRAVAEMWQRSGVKRFHASWGPKAAEMTGEQRAQYLLDIERAPKTLIHDIDA